MKVKAIVKRMRARAYQIHERSLSLQNGDQAKAERARFLALVLLEVSELIAPCSKKKRKQGRQKVKEKKPTKKVKKAKKRKSQKKEAQEQNAHNAPLPVAREAIR